MSEMLYVVTPNNFKGVDLDKLEEKVKTKKLQYKRTEYGLFFNGDNYVEMHEMARECIEDNVTDDK